MTSRKSKTIPVIIAFLFLGVIVYLFVNIKQSQVTCEKSTTFDSGVRYNEVIIVTTDGKKITNMDLTKSVVLPDKFANKTHIDQMRETFERTLEYLGNNVKYTVSDNKIIANIQVNKNEILLLDNVQFIMTDDLYMKVNSNTKSNLVVPLTIGDNYTDSDLMKYLKNYNYSCK